MEVSSTSWVHKNEAITAFAKIRVPFLIIIRVSDCGFLRIFARIRVDTWCQLQLFKKWGISSSTISTSNSSRPRAFSKHLLGGPWREDRNVEAPCDTREAGGKDKLETLTKRLNNLCKSHLQKLEIDQHAQVTEMLQEVSMTQFLFSQTIIDHLCYAIHNPAV
jgi:hypothetical protein